MLAYVEVGMMSNDGVTQGVPMLHGVPVSNFVLWLVLLLPFYVMFCWMDRETVRDSSR